ncbi:hypothetical protein [Halopelagius longus]|uniref:Uncharacterized protein n=1 Tax=Halopelagius longus TaxID=1236180 RepID=A0A1H1GMU1_9EURY|nr:hypothetical protein [Halopelagius longus]RDI69647.1 hypothetical protein DWB78_17905 [Halopelagius longus]SDR14532.1 hypothetical protein SAMN05216278_3777 [Halopelagius longus]
MSDDAPVEGDEYSHTDGTTEIVYLTEDGRVLTLREYPSTNAFEDAVETAAYRGINEAVAALPGREEFLDTELPGDADEDDGPARNDAPEE